MGHDDLLDLLGHLLHARGGHVLDVSAAVEQYVRGAAVGERVELALVARGDDVVVVHVPLVVVLGQREVVARVERGAGVDHGRVQLVGRVVRL